MEGEKSFDKCPWCGDDIVCLAGDDEWKFSASVSMVAEEKRIELLVSVGNEDLVNRSIDINYCPMCGRKL